MEERKKPAIIPLKRRRHLHESTQRLEGHNQYHSEKLKFRCNSEKHFHSNHSKIERQRSYDAEETTASEKETIKEQNKRTGMVQYKFKNNSVLDDRKEFLKASIETPNVLIDHSSPKVLFNITRQDM